MTKVNILGKRARIGDLKVRIGSYDNLDLYVCSNPVFDAARRIWRFWLKISNLKNFRVHKFDLELTFVLLHFVSCCEPSDRSI